MTWTYQATGSTISVYDHTDTLVVENIEFSPSWSGVPKPVYDTMADAAREAIARGDLEYAVQVFADAIADDIEEGRP